MFIEYAQRDPFFFFSWILIIVFSICFHEYAHAWMALRKGDDTAARLGHLSLNPLIQMGWVSLIMLAMIGIAWGSVPVNVSRMRGRSAHAQVALAGPVANLALCAIFGMVAGLGQLLNLTEEIQRFLMMAAMANGVLFLFNMIPLPMFDGWTVLSYFIEPMQRVDLRMASGYSWMALIVIWTTGIMDGIWKVGAVMGRSFQSIILAIAGIFGA
ncbi:MAG TPA: site-2 protease family protein [Kiritimatiellia bacterium]|nr:site-2 protease family protein [Kiritimatiellia bacterium]